MKTRDISLFHALSIATACSVASAQCAWTELEISPSIYSINSMVLLTNGRIAAAGWAAGRHSVCVWNGTTWSVIGSVEGAGNSVRALKERPNGNLIAGGEFFTINNVNARCIALWNGTSWSPFGAGPDVLVNCLALLPNGDVIVGGTGRIDSLSRWDGVRWSSFGANGQPNEVYAIVVWFGQIVVSGRFASTPNAFVNRVAIWGGNSWQSLGTFNNVVNHLAVLPDGALLAGGGFTSVDGQSANKIAVLRGGWQPLGAGVSRHDDYAPSANVTSSAVLPNGDLVVGGNFTLAGGVLSDLVARWTGATWVPLGMNIHDRSYLGMNHVAELITLPDGRLVAGGNFDLQNNDSNTEDVATFDANQLVQFIQQPTSQDIPLDGDVSFQVAVVGQGPFSYQWRRNGAAITNDSRINGAATDRLNLVNVSSGDQGDYDCRITNHCGYSVSLPAYLRCAPVILEQPLTIERLVCGLQLHVAVATTNGCTFQWRRNGENIGDADGVYLGTSTPSLTIYSSDSSVFASYSCEISNACGTVVSEECSVLCPSDFTLDQATDGDDVVAFFDLWDANDLAADITCDGGVDSDDVIAFFELWDSGC